METVPCGGQSRGAVSVPGDEVARELLREPPKEEDDDPMKKTSNKRLAVDRETVKALLVELPSGQLRYVDGGAPRDTEGSSCNSTEPRCGGCSSATFTRA